MDKALQHCDKCHQQIEGMARHISLCVPSNIDCKVCSSPSLQALKKEIEEYSTKNNGVKSAEGVFGDYNQNLAYFGDEVWNEKGKQYKIFGCSYLYPNTLLGPVHDACTSLKRTLMATVGAVMKHWYFFSPLILIFYKRAFKAFVYWFAEIYESDLKQKTYKHLSEFAPVPREMIRAGLVLAQRIPLKGNQEFNEDFRKEFEGVDGQEFRIRARRCVWAIGTFVQSDSAYRLRPQDALSNLDKEKLRENPRKEILRLFDMVLERDNTIKHKTAQLRRMASLLLLFPPVTKTAYEYFNELKVEEFQPDEADVYFADRNQ